MEASRGNRAGARAPGPVPRRTVLRTVFALSVVGGTAGALAPIVAADEDGVQAPGRRLPNTFDEVYRGRRIHGSTTADDDPGVSVDGRPLQVMRRADGSWLSMVNHYRSYPTPLEAARAAVDELGTAQLAMTSMHQL